MRRGGGRQSQDLIRRSQVLYGRKLPPALPIVLYNGESRWTAATDVAELIPRAPGLVARYLPKLQYLLIDESQVSTMDLRHTRNLMVAIIQVERPASEQALLQCIDWLKDWLSDNPKLRRTFAIWIRAVVLRQSRHTLALPKVRDLKELKMTLAERLDVWARQHENRGLEKGLEEGLEKGMARGLAQGEALVLQRLLARRFGPLPADAIQAISTAPVEQVELWLDRLLDAQSLDEVPHS